MIVTSADRVVPHVQTVTTYASDFDEVQAIQLDADDIDELQFAFTNLLSTVTEEQVGEQFELLWPHGKAVCCTYVTDTACYGFAPFSSCVVAAVFGYGK